MKQYANETMCQCGNEEIKAKEQAKAQLSKVKGLKSPEFVELMNCGTVEALISPQLKSSNYELCIVNYSLLIAPDSPKLY